MLSDRFQVYFLQKQLFFCFIVFSAFYYDRYTARPLSKIIQKNLDRNAKAWYDKYV